MPLTVVGYAGHGADMDKMRRWAVWPKWGAAVNLLSGDFVLSGL